MQEFIRKLLYRHQKKPGWKRAFLVGAKGLITITLLESLNAIFGVPFLMAPFGASTILIYTNPEDEYSQPINVMSGYLICGLLSLVVFPLFPQQFWAIGIVLGLCITTMALLRITHPPAGAVPIVIYYGTQDPTFWFLFSPIFCGSATLVLFAMIMLHGRYPREISSNMGSKK